MDPSDFAHGDWVKEATAKVKTPPQGSATYYAEGTGEVDIRITSDYFVVIESLEGASILLRWRLGEVRCSCGDRGSNRVHGVFAGIEDEEEEYSAQGHEGRHIFAVYFLSQ